MKTFLIAIGVGVALAGSYAQTETMKEADLLKQIGSFGTPGAEPSPTGSASKSEPSPPKKEKERPPPAPTEITCTKEATYDNKTRRAVFVGEVQAKGPEFTINTDKLTAILRDTAAEKTAGAPATGGLESATAEGHVVIIQVKPGAKGEPPTRSVGKAERADYDGKAGTITLSGWPQVQQGINTQVATAAHTRMILNREGKQMNTIGPSKTVIQESIDKP